MHKALIYSLSQEFYANYPKPQYKEILDKPARPYCCLTIDCGRDYFICIPYRSHINHKYAFKFKSTARSKNNSSGLDYSKIVIILKENQQAYLTSNAVVDNDEYSETLRNINTIISEAASYVDDYVAHIKGTQKLHIREFDRRYKLSALPYFSIELEINYPKNPSHNKKALAKSRNI